MTEDDGAAICLSERPLRHVIHTWLTGPVEVFLFMKGNISQIAHGNRRLACRRSKKALMFPQITTASSRSSTKVEVQGGKRTTTTQRASHFEL